MLLLVGLAGVPQKARANDYLEKEKHFMVYTSGADRIHFTIPVWAEGAYDRYANASTFATNFKQRYTLTPSEFLNKNAETTNNTNI